jgi:hypothetical protein
LAIAGRLATPLLVGAVLAPLALAGCQSSHSMSAQSLTAGLTSFVRGKSYSARDRECLERAIFFEANRSSRDGMIAVGTVVMNRLRSGKHGDTICAVVGEKRQFAPGVLTRRMNSKGLPDVQEAADAVLRGERSAKLKNAMHFHTAGRKFRYNNMHYVLVAGGNAFYEKRGRNWQPLPPETTSMVAAAEPAPQVQPAVIQVASAAPAAPTSVDPLPVAEPTVATPTLLAAAPAEAAPVTMAMLPTPRPSEEASIAAAPTIAAAPMSEPADEPIMSFGVTEDDATAIGALIVGGDRPASIY